MQVSSSEWSLTVDRTLNLLENMSTIKINRHSTLSPKSMNIILVSSNGKNCSFENELEIDERDDEWIKSCVGSSDVSVFSNVNLKSIGDVVDFIIFHLHINYILIRQLLYLSHSFPSYPNAKLFEIKLVKQESKPHITFEISGSFEQKLKLAFKPIQSQGDSSKQSEILTLEYTNKEGVQSLIELEAYPEDEMYRKKDNLFLECAWCMEKDDKTLLQSHHITRKNMRIIMYLLGMSQKSR